MKLLYLYLYLCLAFLTTAKLILNDDSRDQQIDSGYVADDLKLFGIDDILDKVGSLLKRDTGSNTNTNTDTTNLSEDLMDWEPIKASISVSESSLIYDFPIDYNSTDASQSYEILIFLTASLCDMPRYFNDDESEDNGLSLYYTFDQNETDTSNMPYARFSNGFAQALVQKDRTTTNENLRIVVEPDSCPNCLTNDTWTFELGVSQDNPVFEYSDAELINVQDTDYDSVIFQAPNDTIVNSSYSYSVYLFEKANVPMKALNQSWCAVKESANTVATYEISKDTTKSSNYYFSIDNLKKNTSYSAVVLGYQRNVSYGGAIFKMVDFSTSSSEACKAIYGLEFCDEVAYSVPTSEGFYNGSQTYDDLINLYDNYTESMYQNFSYALQQIPCDANLDSRYSPIRTCDDCADSYKKWLCGITIPRCSSEEQPLYKYYDSNEGRNDFISETVRPPEPYYEILPCVSTCYAIARDCPPDFGFSCPTNEDFIKRSYSDPKYLGEDETYAACNGNVSYIKKSSGGVKLDHGSHFVWTLWALFSFALFVL